MNWHLAPGTGFCEVGGGLVFLDLTRDRYISLREGDRAAFDRLRAGEPNDSAAMTRLVATGFLARGEGGCPIEPTSADIPSRDLSAMADAGFSIAASLAAARALLWAKRAMRPERIAGTVAGLRRRKSKLGACYAETAAVEIAARYAACRWVNPTPPRCLVDALALDHILLSRGLHASLVFGVRTAPFAAHCWLQTPEWILTGTAAEARNFTPILVVA